jgi:hypothetical protein
MIGIGQHTMSAGDWVFVVALQVGLLALAMLALWVAVRATRSAR